MYQAGDKIIETNLKGVETEWKIIRKESSINRMPIQYVARRISDGFVRCVGENRIRKS